MRVQEEEAETERGGGCEERDGGWHVDRGGGWEP